MSKDVNFACIKYRSGLLNEGFDVERGGGDQWGGPSRNNEDLTPESYRQQQSQIMQGIAMLFLLLSANLLRERKKTFHSI